MRTKTLSSFMLAGGLFAFTASALHAQVGINNLGSTPDPSAILDLQTGNTGVLKGFLPQAVSLTNVTTATVTSPATGLIVYSPTAPTGGDGAGYYYWSGTSWLSLGTGSAATSLTGSGTADYVAVWSSASNLSTGLIQDNGSQVTVNEALGTSGVLMYNVSTGEDAFAGYVSSGGAGYYGVAGFNSGGVGTYGSGLTYGVYGIGNEYGAGSGGYFTDGTDYATTGDITNGNGVTAYGASNGGYFTDAAGDVGEAANNSNGFGVYGYGSYVGGYFTDATGVWAWVGDGIGDNCGANIFDPAETEEGRIGDGNTLSGVYGSSESETGYGLYGYNGYGTAGDGIGIYGEGSGAAGYLVAFAAGNVPGIYGEGANMGICGYADGSSSVWPVYGSNDDGARWAALAYYNGTDYKVTGSGSAASTVKDANNITRIMDCPEAPEILFEDYGSGTLVNGRVHIDLDPTYAINVTINDKHALRVMITLNDECNGVFVTNRTATGFDVVELNHGTSNASFTYEVIANRADVYDAKGTLLSKNADVRFQEYVSPVDLTKAGRIMKVAPDKQKGVTVKAPKMIKPVVPAKSVSAAGTNNPNAKYSK